MLPINFSIWGTCVTTDIFDSAANDGSIVKTNPLRCNSVFSACNRFPEYLPIKHTSSYINPMLKTMFEGNCKEYLYDNLGEYIIIDLIEERFQLLKVDDTYVLQSGWWNNSNIQEMLNRGGYSQKKIKYSELDDSFVHERIKRFCEMILSLYDPSRIIINEIYMVDKYVDKNGDIKIFDNAEKIAEINLYLKRYYSELKGNFGVGARVIEMPDNTLADEKNVHGLSPVHFKSEYYIEMHKKLKELVYRDAFVRKSKPLLDSKIDIRLNKSVCDICKQYDLSDYLTNFLGLIENISSFHGKRVLWLGKPLIPHGLTRALGCEKWVCFDLVSAPYCIEKNEKYIIDLQDVFENKVLASGMEQLIKRNNYIIFRGIETNISSYFFDKFDLVISRTYLERSQNIPHLLEVVYRCLRNNGRFYGMINPIWSGAGGCRWHIGKDSFDNSSTVPRFAHLIYNYEELYNLLKQHYDPGQYDFFKICKSILYGSKEANLNHLFYEDYRFFMKESLFTEKDVHIMASAHLTDEERSLLDAKYPNKNHEVYSILLTGKK